MKFTINSGDFLNKVRTLAKAQASKTSMMILECIRLELRNDSIHLTSSDGNVTLQTTIPVTNVGDWNQSICINSQVLISALSELSNQPIVFIANDQTFAIEIQYSGGHFQFVGQSSADFPETSGAHYDMIEIAIPTRVLTSGLDLVKGCVANDELRPIMNGVCFDFTSEGLVLVSSDGHKLARQQYSAVLTDSPQRFVLPTKAAQIMQLIGKQELDVVVQFDARRAVFTTDDYVFNTVLVEGSFPKYDAVIPQDNPFMVSIDRDTFISALRRVLVFSDLSTNLISLSVTKEQLTIATQDFDFSQSSEESISCESNCDMMKIGFKGSFLLNLLRILPQGEIAMSLSDATRAGVFTPMTQSENEKLLLLLMPMMLQS